ncbi:MAG: hypothetical protein CMP27_05260 [Roseibacillus sp.]|nr:hypothetical protein [Roseibacillus sp.]
MRYALFEFGQPLATLLYETGKFHDFYRANFSITAERVKWHAELSCLLVENRSGYPYQAAAERQ